VRISNSVATNKVCLISGPLLHSDNVQITSKCGSLKEVFCPCLSEYHAIVFRILTITVYCVWT